MLHARRIPFRLPSLRGRGHIRFPQGPTTMCFDARTVQLKTQNVRFTAAFLMPEPSASSGRSGLFPRFCVQWKRGCCVPSRSARPWFDRQPRSFRTGRQHKPSSRREFVRLRNPQSRKRVRSGFHYAFGVTSEGVITLVTTERRKRFKSLRTKGLAWVELASTKKISGETPNCPQFCLW